MAKEEQLAWWISALIILFFLVKLLKEYHSLDKIKHKSTKKRQGASNSNHEKLILIVTIWILILLIISHIIFGSEYLIYQLYPSYNFHKYISKIGELFWISYQSLAFVWETLRLNECFFGTQYEISNITNGYFILLAVSITTCAVLTLFNIATTIASIVHAICGIIYILSIYYQFSSKLLKLIVTLHCASGRDTLDRQQQQIVHLIAKQTLLCLVFCLSIVLFIIIFGIRYLFEENSNKDEKIIIRYAYEIVDASYDIVLTVCIWFTFGFADKQFKRLCSRIHYCCIRRFKKQAQTRMMKRKMFTLSKNLQTMVKDTSDLSGSGKIRSTSQSKDVSTDQNVNNYHYNPKPFDTAPKPPPMSKQTAACASIKIDGE